MPPRKKLARRGMAPGGTVLLGDAAPSLRPALPSLAAISPATPRLDPALEKMNEESFDATEVERHRFISSCITSTVAEWASDARFLIEAHPPRELL